MRQDFIKKVKTILEEQKTKISAQSFTADTVANIDMDGDDTDEIQAKIIARADATLALRNKEKLFKIEKAFQKMVDGKFGLCEECEEEIAEKRILANPECITCISCAEELEMLKKRSVLR